MQNSLQQVINRISGGTPLKRHHDIINRKTPLLSIAFEDTLSFIGAPPKNAERTTIEELQTLQHIPQRLDDPYITEMNERYIDLLFACVYPPHATTELKSKVQQIVDEADKFIVQAKYHYNRPRPRQLAAFYGLELTPVFNPSCPSYPSGHTAKTMVAHLALQRLTKDTSYRLEAAKQIVADVAYSRLQTKVHFPSDVKAGLAFAQKLITGHLL